ncbi:hypothetical protein E2320_000201, partial [Naja naja]
KVQKVEPYLYLGHKLLKGSSIPVLPNLQIQKTYTLVQWQKLLGDMLPLFQSLKGPQWPGDEVTLTEFQRSCLCAIMQKLKEKYVDRIASSLINLNLAIFPTSPLPTGCLYTSVSDKRINIHEWINLSATLPHNIYPHQEALEDLIIKGRKQSLSLSGQD